MKKYILTIVILQLAFFSSFMNVFVLAYSQSSSNLVMEPRYSTDGEVPEYSSLPMPVDPIVIDGNMGWISAANESWVTIEDEVYIIENLSIEGLDQVSCIVIKNSNVPFMIRNCTLFTAHNTNITFVGFSAIELSNVANGQIIGNQILDNHNHGIMLRNSVNITVTKN